MKKPSSLEQVLDPLWQDLLHPDSPNLKNALQLLLAAMEKRAKATHASSISADAFSLEVLSEKASTFAKYIIAAYSNAAIYQALLERAENLWIEGAEAQAAFARLSDLIVDEIKRDLGQSQSHLVAAGPELGLSKQEQDNIAYLYSSTVRRDMVLREAAGEPTLQPHYAPGDITNLVLALSVVLAPMN